VVTEVTLRLRPAPSGTPRDRRGPFQILVSPGGPCPDHPARVTPAVIEDVDGPAGGGGGMEAFLGIAADAAALLLARVDTPGGNTVRPRESASGSNP